MNHRAKYVVILLLALGLLILTRGILAPFIIAVITAYILIPLVDRAQRFFRLPRVLVIALFYLIFIGTLTLVIVLVEPELTRQTTGPNGLFKSGASVADSVLDIASKNDRIVDILRRGGVDIVPYGDPRYEEKRAILARRLQAEIDRATQPGQVRELATTTFNILLKVVIWFFATFYLLLNGRNHMHYLYRFVPDDRIDQVHTVMGRIHTILGGYLRGQFYLMIIMATASYVILRILKVPYTLPIAIGTGVLEIVPFIGPIIATTIAGLVALSTQGTATMIAVVIAYFVMRQIEDQIVIPQMIGRVVHVDPVVTIFVVLAGERIGGIVGVLLAVPAAAAARVVLDEIFPPKVAGDAPSELTEIAVAGTGLPNDPESPRARSWLRRPHTPPPVPEISED